MKIAQYFYAKTVIFGFIFNISILVAMKQNSAFISEPQPTFFVALERLKGINLQPTVFDLIGAYALIKQMFEIKKENYAIEPPEFLTKLKRMLYAQPSLVIVQNEVGNTPLHCAADLGCYKAVSILLDHNAQVNMQNNSGQTPLHLAVLYGDKRIGIIGALLRTDGININIQDLYGNTPLHLAVLHSRDNCKIMINYIIICLLNSGADKTIRNSSGRTPADEARFTINDGQLAEFIEDFVSHIRE